MTNQLGAVPNRPPSFIVTLSPSIIVIRLKWRGSPLITDMFNLVKK